MTRVALALSALLASTAVVIEVAEGRKRASRPSSAPEEAASTDGTADGAAPPATGEQNSAQNHYHDVEVLQVVVHSFGT